MDMLNLNKGLFIFVRVSLCLWMLMLWFVFIIVSLICSDDGSPSYSFNKTFMIYVTDVNEAPTNVWLNGSVHLLENVDSGYGLGILVCDDPDENQTHSFQVLGKFNDTFNVSKK